MPLDTCFSKFLEEKSLIRSRPLDSLRGTKVAIDAHNWMKVLTPKINEPFQAVMGGVPLTMGRAIKTELERFKKAGITPVFVFNGLPMILTQTPQQLVQNHFLIEIYEKREAAWHAHHENKAGCKQLFEQTGSTITSSEFQHNLIRILRENKVEFLKAPYMAWAQMAHYCQPKERCVHQIQGPNELIMFEHVEVLILDFHFDAPTPEFEYIVKSEIKHALMQDAEADPTLSNQKLTDLQFLDCCLLSGLKGQIKHPRHFAHVQFVKIAQTLRKFGHACNFILSKPGTTRDKDQGNMLLAKNHLRIRAVIRHSLVFTLDGQCQPMTATRHKDEGKNERVPCNLSDLWGLRLPNILYFFLSIGAIQTQVLINVVQNQMIETIPQMDTEDYRMLLHRILPLRTQIAHQLITQLSAKDERYHKREAMACWRWYMKNPCSVAQPPAIVLDEWQLEHHQIAKLQKEHKDQDGAPAALDFLFVVTHFHKNATKVHQYRSVEEVICAIHLKALDLLGYFTHATQSEDPQSGLSMFSDALMKTNAPEFSEYSVLLVELFRTKALTCSHFKFMKPESGESESEYSKDPWESDGTRNTVHFPSELKLPSQYSKATAPMQQNYEKCCLLVSRIWSLLPMALSQDEAWYSDVSKDLLAFNTVVRALHKTLRNLIEVIAAVLFLEKKTEIDPYHYNELPQQLPFGQESNTAMGVVIDYIMRNDEHFGEPQLYYNRAERLKYLAEVKFTCCHDLEADLYKGFRFWCTAKTIYEELKKEKSPHSAIIREIEEIFPHADDMLRVKLHRVIDLGDQKWAHEDYVDPEGPPPVVEE
eukprot:TRINITY_DN1865_c0_g1_i10.p1 TRINITY_DN1865_c0_g1~~TRINITY_DN1865_c0_g1_i10.p1  ORF type:complete len:843 (+),score=366.13 TRINITY_DN1865_c0_g1_i10:79-2529(+)